MKNINLLNIILFMLFANVYSQSEDMKLDFSEAIEHCRVEAKLTDDLMAELLNFWSEDFKFERREYGCALECLGKYFNLFTGSMRVHHGNADEFIKSLSSGASMAGSLITMIHECEQKYDHESDHCWRLLRIAECFKDSAVGKGIAADVELLMIEVFLEAEDD